MRFNRILFIRPNLRGFHNTPAYPHPGIGFLMASLEAHGAECDFMDMYLNYTDSVLEERIRAFKPDLIGVTVYTYRRLVAYDMVRHVKQIADVPVVIGGPHVSLYGAKALEEGAADFAIRNEGEYPIVDLCSGKLFKEIKGLIYHENGSIVENKHCFVEDLDRLPFPKHRSSDIKKYPQYKIPIVSSRGCPFHCIYCSIVMTMGRKFRPRSPKNILAELNYWYEKGIRRFDFVDDTFAQSNERVFELCDLIEQEGLRNAVFGCSQGIRAHTVNKPLLKRMYDVGFRDLGFGIESANDSVLRTIKKGQTLNQIDETIKTACELGFDVGLFFMIGLPGETLDDVRRSFSFAMKYPVRYANFYNIIPYPGTEMFNWLEQNSLFEIEPHIYLNEINTRGEAPFFHTPTMSVAERIAAIKEGKKVSQRVYYNFRRHQLRRFGIFGDIIARIIATKGVSNILEKVNQNFFMDKLFCLVRNKIKGVDALHAM